MSKSKPWGPLNRRENSITYFHDNGLILLEESAVWSRSLVAPNEAEQRGWRDSMTQIIQCEGHLNSLCDLSVRSYLYTEHREQQHTVKQQKHPVFVCM